VKAAPDRSAAPTTGLSTDDEVVFGHVWPFFSPGEYIVEIVASQEKPSPYAAKDLAAKKRRPDPEVGAWKWLVDVRVEAGADPQTARALETWRKQHDGQAPVTFFSCPFRRSARSGRIITPRRGEKLYDSLEALLGRPVRPGDRIKLHSCVGARVRVKVVDVGRDRDGDRRAAYSRYSIARKLLSLEKADGREPKAGSRQPVAYSRHFHPIGEIDQKVAGRTFESSAGGSDGVASPIGETGYDRPGGAAKQTAPPGPTPREERLRIERAFGRGAALADIRRSGPCPCCGAAMFSREYSTPRCIWCESGRWPR